MPVPKTYKLQNGCVNCKHAFRPYNPEYVEVCCTFGENTDEIIKMHDAHWKHPLASDGKWHKWQDKHDVSVRGICDNWEER